jgi:DNA repair protein RadA/Sms
MTLNEPAADLPAALAIASSLTNRPIPSHVVSFGEVGLSGELRGVGRLEARLKEAAQMGFRDVILPKTGLQGVPVPKGLNLIAVKSVDEAIDAALAEFAAKKEEMFSKT